MKIKKILEPVEKQPFFDSSFIAVLHFDNNKIKFANKNYYLYQKIISKF